MLLKNAAHLSGVFFIACFRQQSVCFLILYINNSIKVNGYSDLKSKFKELAFFKLHK